ncbi:hypothetical protein CYMTET_52755 [Cymbomonas tetramitiformis]|uniref:RING-type domain-containing protein n=1 Tax=Cymbomonas tetramitiformis TaxID=36881 RepID=A0AAE0BIC9_9CHLO|nr:hypothetical protein CYMTET_52755 [Cymbomonas tetramitiformis]
MPTASWHFHCLGACTASSSCVWCADVGECRSIGPYKSTIAAEPSSRIIYSEALFEKTYGYNVTTSVPAGMCEAVVHSAESCSIEHYCKHSYASATCNQCLRYDGCGWAVYENGVGHCQSGTVTGHFLWTAEESPSQSWKFGNWARYFQTNTWESRCYDSPPRHASPPSPNFPGGHTSTTGVEISITIVFIFLILAAICSAYWMCRLFLRRTATERLEATAQLPVMASDARAGVSEVDLEVLCPLSKAQNDLEDDCCICLSAPCNGEGIRVLPCKHIVHSECIGPWFKAHSCCPLCKQDVLASGDMTTLYDMRGIEGQQHSAAVLPVFSDTGESLSERAPGSSGHVIELPTYIVHSADLSSAPELDSYSDALSTVYVAETENVEVIDLHDAILARSPQT